MRRIIEYVWMAVGAFALVEAYLSAKKVGWNHDETYLFLIVFVLAAFMFFFRRWQRLKKNKK